MNRSITGLTKEFVPAILEESVEQTQKMFDAFALLKPVPQAIQLDIIDGEFADAITIEPNALEMIDTHNFQIDLHLMTQEPIDFVLELQTLPNIRYVIGQVEHMSSLIDFAEEVHGTLQKKVGFSLDIYTPLSAIDEEVWPQVDLVQIMANKAGEQGQTFQASTVERIQEAANWRASQNLNFAIAVDIGINQETAQLAFDAGADILAVGSHIKGADAQNNWSTLQTLMQTK